MTDKPLTLHTIAERLYDLGEREREMSTLHAVEAYKAAAHVLQLAEESGFSRLMADMMAAPQPPKVEPGDTCAVCGHEDTSHSRGSGRCLFGKCRCLVYMQDEPVDEMEPSS